MGERAVWHTNLQPCLPEIVRRLRAHLWGSLPDSRAWHTKGCCDANVAAEARCGQRLTRGRTEVQSRARTGRQTCFPTRPVPPPRRPSNSAGVGQGTEGETPVAQHPHLHAQHLWVPAPTCLPARHRPDISTSPHSPPASPGLALQPTHSSSASLCSEEPRSSSQSPFCLGEAGKGEEAAGAGRRSRQISPCVALDKSGISLRADRGLDDGLDVLEQGEDADKRGKTERGQ